MALIKSSEKNGLLEVSFHDVTSRNSFSLEAALELQSALARADQCSALVFRAPGRVFCSGGQLDDYAQMEVASEGIEVNNRIRSALAELDGLEIPTVCAVTGDCFGGGIELMSAFDFVLATPNALFGLWQRRIGLSFGWGGGARIEERIGTQKLRAWSLSSQLIGADEALKAGLVDEVHHEGKILERAEVLARTLAQLPSAPVSHLKKYEAENEVSAFNELWWNPEHRQILDRRKKR
ncbi:MAG TPA: enoyl-CoA hydratase/isomerase family protein [Bdellovibrionales bacterium]|nr:enoyl-CoA hydratase/isomerase family protein [Bdellovibrionales bacterium]